ncbi:hypothetical protein [Streptomyces sp. ISL-36]|uniref:hypothetical protein n=1 Tax=Streptomyces sp. ISL-36 TaxID=2819182 RepID=UPI002035D880|nr:hypothetical protein [Streptomyces sp. ISL-36]
MLDEHGRVHTDTTWVAQPGGSGIAGLLSDAPTGTEVLTNDLREQVGTALAYTEGRAVGVAALGDATGTVRAFGDVAATVALHNGPVTALAAVRMRLDSETTVPLIYSGGVDGAVHVWSPGNAPMTAPVLQRPCPVVSLDAEATKNGLATVVAWGDGAVECVYWDTGVQQTFRPGPPVRAVVLDEDGRVLIGMDEALTCLIPQQPRFDGDVA